MWQDMEQVAHKSCGCPIRGSVQRQAKWGIEQSGLVKGVPVHGRRLETR